MASTIAIYTGDGTTTDFTVPFDYLAKKFVKVSVGLTVLEGGDYGDTSKDFYFIDKTTVRLRTPPQAGAEVTVRRYTSATDRVVSFKDASILKATDLDTSSIQTIHIAEEGRDVINDALIVNKEGNWDAKGHRVVNVGDAVNDGDAVNLKLYKADSMGAYQSRVEAEKARDRAVEAEANAKESEKAVTDIAEILVPMVPDVKVVAENIDHVVTDSNNMDKINIVGTDLKGALHDSVYDDYGDLGNPEAPLPVITGGNIKVVADNIEDVKTVAGCAPDFDKIINSVDTVTNLTVRAETAATESEASATNAKESEKAVTDIAEILVPMVPDVKVVADNIDHVVTDSNNINKINIVGTDLEGTLHDSVYDDYGDLGNPEAPLPVITGGNIKVVADNIEDVKTVAGLAPDFDKVINSVDTVTNLTVRAETAATESEASATQAGESEANARASEAMATSKATEAKDWANKMDGTVDGSEYSAKYYANKVKTDGGQAVETAKAQALQQITTAKTTAIKEIGDKGTQQKALLDTQVAEATRQAKLAEASATLASNEADAAQTAERASTASAVASEASAKNSANSASMASEQVTIATNKATEAKNYADEAALSKDAAKTSEDNAKRYADSAAGAVSGKLDKAVFDGFVDYGDLGTP